MKININDKMCGVYCIKNIINNNLYIGSSKNLKLRYFNHKTKLKNNKHENKHLQNAWNLYGETKFTFELLEECPETILEKTEQKHIDEKNPKYNILKKAYSVKGFFHSETTKKKISTRHSGKNHWNYSGEHTFFHPVIGKIFCDIHNLSNKYNLLLSAVYKLVKGELHKHKNWIYCGKNKNISIAEIQNIYTRAVQKKKNIYALYNGKEKFIGTIKEFSIKFNIKYSSIKHILNGKRKMAKLWICVSKNINKNYIFPDNLNEIYFNLLKTNKRIKK
jgi:group I intron endonuclease